MENRQVAALFAEMAELHDIRGDGYRARALGRVARMIEELEEPAGSLLVFGELGRRHGVGRGTLDRLGEILRTGSCRDLERLRAEMPPGIRELLEINGVGPRTARDLYTYLRIGSVAELEAAARDGRLAAVPRLGERGAERLLRAIAHHRLSAGRTPLPEALRLGETLVAGLASEPDLFAVELAGSLRRRRDTVGDLDVLVCAHLAAPVIARFVTHPLVADVIKRGRQAVSVRLGSGQQVDLRVLPPETYGAALHYFTGSKQHNIAVRILGNRRRLKISEHGIFRRADLHRLAGAHEADVFAAVGLPFIPPELREDEGELEAAARGTLPCLVEDADLGSDLRVHAPPGEAHALARAARARGLRGLALVEPFPGRPAGVRRREAAAVEESAGLRVLVAAEVTVAADGSLGAAVADLAGFDWVLAALPDAAELDREAATRALVTAAASGAVDRLAHLRGRRLAESRGRELDLERVLHTAAAAGVAVELDASPARLDLDAAGCRLARRAHVPVAVGSGARDPAGLTDLRLGLYTARRGWLEAGDVLNSLPPDEIAARHRARKPRRAVAVSTPAPLLRALRRRPLAGTTAARLRAWFAGEPDSELEAALRALGDDPVRQAFALLEALPVNTKR